MKETIFIIISHFIALLIGIVISYFMVLEAITSDFITLREQLLNLASMIAVYGLIGFLFGYLATAKAWRWGYWLCGPAIIIVGTFNITAFSWGTLILYLHYIAIILGSSCGGAYLGTKVMLSRWPDGPLKRQDLCDAICRLPNGPSPDMPSDLQ